MFFEMAAPIVNDLVTRQSIGYTQHFSYVKSTLFIMEGEEIRHEKDEIPQVILDRVLTNGDNVIDWVYINSIHVTSEKGKHKWDKSLLP